MRRFLSLVLLLVFGLPTVAPALGLATGDADSHLPVCCRRNGAHHCTMSAVEEAALLRGTNLTTVGTKCPRYPTLAQQLQHHDLAFHISPGTTLGLVSEPAPVAQAAAWARAAEAGARHKRGPPQHLL